MLDNIRKWLFGYSTNEYGIEKWYRFGQLHRTDGPAIRCKRGYELWYQFGQVHRTDGPAVVITMTDKQAFIDEAMTLPFSYSRDFIIFEMILTKNVHRWYLRGVHYSLDEYCKKIDQKDAMRLKLEYAHENC